ncbi:unnamed protein product [Arabis nemorensis]|uniref:Uncharacterized protein n=1 Tax=Arabis nemorensis TaxID=586526 RepID=A0A565B0M9_9BRAS|nr:unnamed protein product [Arabis nemorensis]
MMRIQLCATFIQYYENRLKYIEGEMAKGENPFPHKFYVSMSIPEYIDKYASLSKGIMLKMNKYL